MHKLLKGYSRKSFQITTLVFKQAFEFIGGKKDANDLLGTRWNSRGEACLYSLKDSLLLTKILISDARMGLAKLT